MTVSHKGQVVLQFLVPISVGYLVAAYFLLRGVLPPAEAIWDNASGAAILSIAAMLVQDLIPKPLKEFLVFFRIRNRLPSHRSFSDKALANPRIDLAGIQRLEERRALTPSDQSRDWYQAYRRTAEEPDIRHYSLRYLGWRDAAALSVALALVSLPVSYTFGEFAVVRVGAMLTIGCLIFYLLCVVAAQRASNELVTSVLVRVSEEGMKNE